LNAITSQLRGFEIDPFAAWLTQTWLEIALNDLLAAAGTRLPELVQVCDTLAQEPAGALFDLVMGNPPYGRVTLMAEQRRRFARSLFGHANLYGVFTDIAMRWTKAAGIIAYVTPTSFLAGEYFKSLRSLLAAEAPPVAVDFIEARRGVFEDVLQEALLATYCKGGKLNRAAVHYFAVSSDASARITHAGRFTVPSEPAAPWLAPRIPDHQNLVDRLARMPHRLAEWGYRVSTGPLVWNRFKDQLRTRTTANTFPLVWAEAVTADGRFIYRAEKRGHQPYFRIEDGDEWLKVTVPCVLVQRTTAKEQTRRLIAAEMPASFIKKNGAVVVENHLSMIRPASKKHPKASTAALSAVLNSSIADEAFRCISGSVAVSAFELEALPLPPPHAMIAIDELLRAMTLLLAPSDWPSKPIRISPIRS
jgi:adenine-specific DNA-methyltransferase